MGPKTKSPTAHSQMVFFTKKIKRTVNIHPQHLGAHLDSHVREQLITEVEGLAVDTTGFVVAVLGIHAPDLTRGQIDHLTGNSTAAAMALY
jgi:DNA-directed RNA polymerase subunit E'/Rpb7